MNVRLVGVVFFVTSLLITWSCAGQSETEQNQENRTVESSNTQSLKVYKMATPQIVELIKNKDWVVAEEPISVEPTAANLLLSLLDEEDPEIRELTLFALNSIPTKEARKGILKALRDEDVNVRSTASRFLMNNYSKDDLKLLHEELSTNEDEMIRESVALVIGKIGDSKSVSHIKEKSNDEVDEHAFHAMHLALVRLHDDENKKQYAERFRHPHPKQRVRALQDFKYVQDKSFIKNILPLLEDQERGMNVGPSAKKIYIRVCDVAVNVLDEILNHPFSFEVGEKKKYSREELLEVSNFLVNMR